MAAQVRQQDRHEQVLGAGVLLPRFVVRAGSARLERKEALRFRRRFTEPRQSLAVGGQPIRHLAVVGPVPCHRIRPDLYFFVGSLEVLYQLVRGSVGISSVVSDVAGERFVKPLDVVKERYAKGEISREEFEQLKNDLTRL